MIDNSTSDNSTASAGLFANVTMLMVVFGAILVGVAGQLSTSCLYGMGKTSSILKITIINFLVRAFIKAVSFNSVGVIGIAIGIVGYQLFNAIGLHIVFFRKLGKLKIHDGAQ